ncbi:mitogen-activated protein kinase 15 isoform 2-T2 [Dama dama]|uniref:mitogen-activated protein kinase 15 isoform X2 n=1 Tax=Dama dama TaxID=30532 RepID=UPI002A3598D7|nr:mitogen-activated protein kinase 15 isoform X2 [Dama dama]
MVPGSRGVAVFQLVTASDLPSSHPTSPCNVWAPAPPRPPAQPGPLAFLPLEPQTPLEVLPPTCASASGVPPPAPPPSPHQVHPRGGHVEPGLHSGGDAAGAALVPWHVHPPPAGAHPGGHPATVQGGPPGAWLCLQHLSSAAPGVPTPWTSSRDSWCLPRTSGSVQSRPCSTPTCRGSGWGWRWAAKLGGALPRQPGPAAPAPAWLAPCRFHCPAREWTLGGAVRLPVQEGAQLSAAEYRRRLYKMILERRGHGRLPKETGLGGSPPTPEPEAQLPSGSPAWNPGRRPRSNPGHGPVHDAPGGAQDPPRQNSDPLHQPPPPGGPGRGARPGGATSSSWVKPSAMEAAPSLTSQAAAQVAVRALIRSDRNLGRGATAPGAPRVPPRPPGAARPGRRMFGASAAQGAQGATRAALGGYSQAYGTVCLSALGCLPLLQGPRA